MTSAISVQNLCKTYRIGSAPSGYRTLRETISEAAAGGLKRLRRTAGTNGDHPDDFHALKDVNFDVRNGEVLGIVGANGAGKSTLLKIISRITPPTSGRV